MLKALMKFLYLFLFTFSLYASTSKCQILLLLEDSHRPPFEREELLRDNILQNVLAGYKDYIYNPNHSEMLFSKGSVMEFENDFKLFTDSDGASADIFLGQLKDGKKVILKGYHVLESSKIAQIVEGALTSQFFANFGLAPKVYGLLSREELLNKKFNFHGHFNPEVHYEIAIIMEYIPDVVNFPKGDLSSILDNEETIFSLEKEIKYFEEFGQRMDRMSLDDRQIFFSKSRKKAYWGDFDAPMIELKEGQRADSLFDLADFEYTAENLDGTVSQFTRFYELIGRKPKTTAQEEAKKLFSKLMRAADFDFPEDFDD